MEEKEKVIEIKVREREREKHTLEREKEGGRGEKERITNNKIEGRNAETSGIEHSSLIVGDELN